MQRTVCSDLEARRVRWPHAPCWRAYHSGRGSGHPGRVRIETGVWPPCLARGTRNIAAARQAYRGPPATGRLDTRAQIAQGNEWARNAPPPPHPDPPPSAWATAISEQASHRSITITTAHPRPRRARPHQRDLIEHALIEHNPCTSISSASSPSGVAAHAVSDSLNVAPRAA
jgi:hypothetical protein